MEASSGLDGEWRDLAKKARYSVRAYARLCRVSPRQFRRLFHSERGQSPRSALHAARFQEAQRLLLAGRPVKAVAAELGFKHAANFSAWFQAAAGRNPSKFAPARSSRLMPAG